MKQRTRRRKRLLFVISSCLFVVSVGRVTAQPFIELGLGGNVVVPTADFGGTPEEFLNGTKYGTRPGAGIHLASRFLFQRIPLRVSINYSIQKNSGAAGGGTLALTEKIFSMSLQPEYFFSPSREDVRGYIGGILELNNFGGDATFSSVAGIPDNKYVISSSERFGVGAALGVLVPLNERITFDLALSYHVMNPFGKQWEQNSTASSPRIDAYQWLNDAADPAASPSDPNHFIAAERTIHTVQLTLSFFFAYSQL